MLEFEQYHEPASNFKQNENNTTQDQQYHYCIGSNSTRGFVCRIAVSWHGMADSPEEIQRRRPPLLPPHWQPLAKRLPERQRGGVRGVRQSGEGGRGGGTDQLLHHPGSLPGWWHTLSWPAQEEDQIRLEMTQEDRGGAVLGKWTHSNPER